MKSNFALFYYWNGRVSEASKISKEAVEISEQSGDIFSRAMAYNSHGISCLGMGVLEEAERYLLEGEAYCENCGLYSWSAVAQLNLGEVYYDAGDPDRSEECHDRSISSLRRIECTPSFQALNRLCIARCRARKNLEQRELQALRVLLLTNRFKLYDGWMQRYMAEILMNFGDQFEAEVEERIHKAIAADMKNETKYLLGRDYALLGEFFKRKGDRAKAQEQLGHAIEIMKKCGADGWVEKYERELAALR